MSNILTTQKNLRYLQEALTAQEQIYVEARARGSLPVAAARVAGFKGPDTAAKALEAREDVRLAVEYTIRHDLHKAHYTRSDVIRGFEDAFRAATTSMEMTAAMREIAKIEGHYAPQKAELTVRVEDLAGASDEDLARMAAIDGEFVDLTDEDPQRLEAK